ncbi:gas vesicle protein K [Streptomyces sp. NRRL F-5135]|uniref:gas vesicle protein K n=1 Tax=Streptomyces sp. NRRL F-5135 TaxID=1463858 RepID=UPI00099CDDC3|nr:gas vesicle protein K [Streptomyces sp. NRRL F-5135]
MTVRHEPPRLPDTREPPRPPGTAGPSEAFAEAARAAARAFDLVPAGPGEPRPDSEVAQRLRTDPDTVERDLIKLVLTIVELLRQLMERTALHRVDQGDLTEDQEERIGMTLMILQDRMSELCERYGLTMNDLNLDLGPLGSLLPRAD